MKPLDYSHVYVIESLRPEDVLTGTRLYHDVILLRMIQRGMSAQCALFSIRTKFELFSVMEEINKAEVFQGANPVLHFEMQGDEEGLEINNGDDISWKELAKLNQPENPDQINIPDNILVMLLSISISHTRALMSQSVLGSKFQDVIIPLINPSNLISTISS
jgi:hypothetical protein